MSNEVPRVSTPGNVRLDEASVTLAYTSELGSSVGVGGFW